MLDLANDFLSLAKAQNEKSSGTFEILQQPFELIYAIETAVAIAAYKIETNDLYLVTSISPNIPTMVSTMIAARIFGCFNLTVSFVCASSFQGFW